jgi:hypothetical protein
MNRNIVFSAILTVCLVPCVLSAPSVGEDTNAKAARRNPETLREKWEIAKLRVEIRTQEWAIAKIEAESEDASQRALGQRILSASQKHNALQAERVQINKLVEKELAPEARVKSSDLKLQAAQAEIEAFEAEHRLRAINKRRKDAQVKLLELRVRMAQTRLGHLDRRLADTDETPNGG